jgi:hypothetical protein
MRLPSSRGAKGCRITAASDVKRLREMSAAAVIAVRIKRVFSFLRERGAVSPEAAVPEAEVPYSDRWYYRRLVAYGAVRKVGDRCYLDEARAQAYIADWRKRALLFAVAATLIFGVFWLVWTLI